MHPIEWLRAVARSIDVPHAELAGEAAAALAALADEPRGLVPACRRLLEHHPQAGPLWWACARMLSAQDLSAEARAIESDLASDQVGMSLALDLPDGEVTVTTIGWSPLIVELEERRPDLDVRVESRDDPARPGPHVVLLEAWAAGSDTYLCPPGSAAAARSAPRDGRESWLAVGVGRRLPEPMFRAVQERIRAASEPWFAAGDMLTRTDVTRVVEPLRIDCPCPPELLR